MNEKQKRYSNIRLRTVNHFIIFMIVSWPLLTVLLANLRIFEHISSLTSIYILYAIAIYVLFSSGTVTLSKLFTWPLFVGVVILESISKSISISSVINLSVFLCGSAICIGISDKAYDYLFAIKIIFYCGLFVSVCIVLDSTLGVFKNNLFALLTNASYNARMNSTVGMFPNNGLNGCYIFPGIAAYITLLRLKQNKKFSIHYIFIFFIFSISALIIQKRGFLIFSIFAALLVYLLLARRQDLKLIDIQKLRRTFSIIIVISICSIILYFQVPMIQELINAIRDRFLNDDGTMSGRTELYNRAFQLFKGNELLGIGWGNFRKNSVGVFGGNTTYAAHNIYIQLLCETGVVGFSFFILAVFNTLKIGINKCKYLISEKTQKEKCIVIKLGIYLELFILCYGFTGNPIYDYNFLMIFFIGVFLTLVPITVKT